jgi:N-acetylglucosamine kinase-like BadF-type ATPase
MKLIADSGSTKTDWALAEDGSSPRIVSTQGINPVHQDRQTIEKVLSSELLPQLAGQRVDEVYFYGSGVRPTETALMQDVLSSALPSARHIEAHGDLLGAARALCGRSEGIACILGTGSNSCLYDGQHIVANTPPLGYVLGDEGGGAVLGIRFLNALYKGGLNDALRQDFETEKGLTLSQIIDRVYRKPLANRFLASLSVFIREHIDDPSVSAIVVDNFRAFLVRNVAAYARRDLPVSFVGSIAYYFSQQLAETLKSEGYALGQICRSPLKALVDFHC